MTREDTPATAEAEPFDPPESYPTFWQAIPVDLPAARAARTADPYIRFTELAEDGPAVALYVERGDI